MCDDRQILEAFAIAGSDWPLMARIDVPATGALAVRADIASISVKAAMYDTPSVLTLNDSVPDTVVLVSGTSTVGWTQDNEGWNMRHVLPATATPTGGTYSVEYLITYTDGCQQRVLWRVYVTAARLG